MKAPHSEYASERMGSNNDSAVEKSWIDSCEEVPLEDCPETFQAF